jgi:hypothetical protein
MLRLVTGLSSQLGHALPYLFRRCNLFANCCGDQGTTDIRRVAKIQDGNRSHGVRWIEEQEK